MASSISRSGTGPVEKAAEILAAEGDANARIKRAEGEAEAIRRVADAVADTAADPTTYLIAMKYLETLERMSAQGQGDKTIFMPYEATGILSSVGGIKEMIDATRAVNGG